MREARAALAKHPRCGAYCRTTGEACKAPAMANGRCRMHGGKSTGRPIVHGRATKEARAQRREVRELLKALRELLES
ncbi:MAG: hypothetical protein FJ031_15795 [Chloroflexi bacterium]|nr:hypothetical protein [Chloroflexota bacterium]